MKKGFLTVLLSVLLSGLTAYAIVKTAVPAANDESQQTVYSSDGQSVRTVNLSLSDYPDFTYAAENAVQAVVYVKVTIKSAATAAVDRPVLPLLLRRRRDGRRP